MRSVFQSEKDGLQHELEQTLTEKEETEKQVDEDIERLQKKVKVMKYIDGYNDEVQGKPSRYLLDAGSLHANQGMVEVLASHAPWMPEATATIIETSRDSSVSAALAESQSVEAR